MTMLRLPLPAQAFGPDVLAALRDADVADETIHLADEAAGWAPELAAGEREALALVVLALLDARAGGSTRLALAEVAPRLARLGMGGAPAARAAALAAALGAAPPAPALAALVGAPGDYRPLLVRGGFLHTERDLLLEERVASALAARLDGPDAPVGAGALAAAVAGAAPPGRRFTGEQEAALRSALLRPLTVVTGGPGTGKTALAAGIVRALMALGVPADEIALAAPTGKAANRIGETLAAALAGAGTGGAAPAPRTLHRLLGFRGGRAGLALAGGELRHHQNYPLPHRAVLVDETSMVDLDLMERLLRAVRPDARLVLMGDADQLPSIDAGAVFRDLGPVALSLTVSHRQDPADPAGAALLAAARAVKAGDLAPLPPPIADPAALAFAGFEQLEAAEGAADRAADRHLLSAFLDVWYRTRVRALPDYEALSSRAYRLRGGELDGAELPALQALLQHHQRLRLLSLTRGPWSPTGADALNAAMARRAAADLQLRPPSESARGAELSPGAPVLMTRNDYLRGLYNGDQGVVVRVSPAGEPARLAAAFPRGAGVALFPLEGVRHDLDLAWASTVHKAQGAELDHAALILPERDVPLLSRELLYTALTRARRSVVVLGRRELLARGAARPLARSSGLAAALDGRAMPRG
jgi:exodeoxyribonuclease V alpha subunit